MDHSYLIGLEESIFQAFLPWVIGCCVFLGVFGLVSLIPARRGHWSALVLVAPPLLSGAYVTGAMAVGGFESWRGLMSPLGLLFIIPSALLLALGLVSLRRWAIARRLGKARAGLKPAVA